MASHFGVGEFTRLPILVVESHVHWGLSDLGFDPWPFLHLVQGQGLAAGRLLGKGRLQRASAGCVMGSLRCWGGFADPLGKPQGDFSCLRGSHKGKNGSHFGGNFRPTNGWCDRGKRMTPRKSIPDLGFL